MIATLLAALLAVVNVPNPSVSYVCDGVTAVYPVNFPYLASGDLAVTSTTVAGIGTTLAQTTDWSVNLASTSSTATLTLNSPGTKCPSGNVLKIARSLLITQPYSFKAQTTYNQSLHETAYDREVMLIQQTDAKVSSIDVKAYVDAAVAATLTGGTVIQPITWNLTGDGAASVFSIPNAVVNSPDLYIVTIDGVFQKPTVDYTVSTAAAQITFTTVPALNAAISVRSFGYARALSVGDNTSVLATGTSVPLALKDWLSLVKVPQAFGAKCDGVTDDAPAIRAAINAAGVGGTVWIPGCASPYFLNSYDPVLSIYGATMFYAKSSQMIIADPNAQLKVANGILNTGLHANGGIVFYVDQKDHVVLKGIRIDMNGANNQTPVGGFHPAYAFAQEGGTYVSFVDNEVLNSPGRNAITITGCSLRAHCSDQCVVKGNLIRNGGTTLSGGNPNQNDWSAFYVECTNSLIDSNRTVMDNYPTSVVPNNGGIEVHGNRTTATNNKLDKAFPGFFVGSNAAGQDLTDVTIENNFIKGHYGLEFFPVSLTDNTGRIKIINNTFLLDKIPGFSGSLVVAIQTLRPGNNIFSSGSAPGTIYDSEISGNTISSTAPTTDTSAGIILSQTRNVRVAGNVMSSLYQYCVQAEGAPKGHSDLTIVGNVCRDFNSANSGVNNMGFIADANGESPPTWTTLTGGVATAVALHQFIRPNANNGFTYDATTAGTTGSGAGPAFTCATPDVTTIADGSVVWTCRNPWKWDGITIKDNVCSQTVNQAGYRCIYTSNDVTANPAVPVTNQVIWPNQVRNVGTLISGTNNGSTFTNLTIAVPQLNSTTHYCSDCTIANPCAGAGNGAIAKRLNGVWVCN